MAYLLLYNSLNTILWLSILISVLSSSPYLEPLSRWTQTLAILEILHSALGITRSPVFTTFTQIFTRCVQVWFVCRPFPYLTASPMYQAMLFAWSVADVVRYAYFVVLSAGISMPYNLKWMRYSLFYILYPIGIGGEWWLMYNAAASTENANTAGVFFFCLGLYVPGAIMMYSYMLKQRKKTLS